MTPLLTNIISDDGGNPSSMRIAMLAVVLIVVSTWAYVSISTGHLQGIPDGARWLVGIVVGGKWAQRFTEGKSITPDVLAQPQK